MTEPNAPTPSPDKLISTPTGGDADRVSTVARYLEANRDRFTEDALVQAARDRGYADEVLEAARARARATAASAPTRHRARRWVLGAYLATFVLLTIGMLASESTQRYGAGFIGTVVLAATLGLALLISMLWLRKGSGPGASMATLLAVPIVLLVGVAGLCVATGLPIPRPA